jgi:hypothetical protein
MIMKRAFLLAGSLSLLGLVGAPMASAQQVNSVADLMEDSRQDSVGQVTSVSQLSDVQPTDWAFQAVQSLVERYGCIAGYPDSSFRGNRSATRYELAAALNACLDNISDKFATKEELEQVKALQEEFAAELATIRGRVDSLEARTSTLEAQQFSTTTKLQGEVVMAGQFGDFLDNPTNVLDSGNNVTGNLQQSRATAIARVRLNFNTSFSGDDLLQTQLEVGNGGQDFFSAAGLGAGNGNFAGITENPNGVPVVVGANTSPGATGVPLVDLGAVDYAGVGNTVTLRRLAYSFKPFEDLTLTFGPRLFPSDFVDFNSYANNSAQDFSSGFFINNPLIISNPVDGPGGAGAAFDWNVNGGPFSIRGTYVAASPTNATASGSTVCNGVGGVGGDVCTGGLLGDPDQATVELEYADTFGSSDQNSFAGRLQFTRANTYNVHSNVVGTNLEATFGRFGVFGRAGFSIDPKLDSSTNGNNPGPRVDLLPAATDNNILTWMGGVGVKDLIVPGSLLSFAAGQPYVILGGGALPNYKSQWNFEGFYRFPINDNITLTPAVMVITNPYNVGDAAYAPDKGAVIQGVLRATFSF